MRETKRSVWLKQRSSGSLSQGLAPKVRGTLQQRRGLLKSRKWSIGAIAAISRWVWVTQHNCKWKCNAFFWVIVPKGNTGEVEIWKVNEEWTGRGSWLLSWQKDDFFSLLLYFIFIHFSFVFRLLGCKCAIFLELYMDS